jgi:methylase of polypeptide subunit release factors
MSLYHLRELLPHDVVGRHALTKVHVPEWAFRPDHWNTTFLRGLMAVSEDFASARLWEVGVGTGINLVALSDRVPDATWYFSDYNPDCVSLASSNLRAAGVDCSSYNPLEGRRNLVYAEVGQTAAPRVDVVFGCLPQVPTTQDLSEADRIAHYYDPSMFPCSRRQACGLALNEALLTAARGVLLPKGKVILNLSGRAGERRLHDMFRECGYSPRVLYETIVPQHAATSLKSLATIESKDQGGPEFEFFADPEARMPLSAGDAEVRRYNGDPVYHKIFVIEGTLVT